MALITRGPTESDESWARRQQILMLAIQRLLDDPRACRALDNHLFTIMLRPVRGTTFTWEPAA
jgi:hypothetical protein